eukprot:scaffold235899_cov49-Prasinocladus_malaysianus.AAC.2
MVNRVGPILVAVQYMGEVAAADTKRVVQDIVVHRWAEVFHGQHLVCIIEDGRDPLEHVCGLVPDLAVVSILECLCIDYSIAVFPVWDYIACAREDLHGSACPKNATVSICN